MPDSQEVQQILELLNYLKIAALLLVFIAAAIVVVTTIMTLYSWANAQDRRDSQKKLAAQHGGKTYPVRYASRKRFRSWLKNFPWESSGILIIEQDCVRYVEEHREIRFDVENSSAEWIGIKLFPNLMLSWFAIGRKGTLHYFTSETGLFVFGSRRSSQAIYKNVEPVIGTDKL